MNKIYGIGLPRTGTASLAEVLKNLGHTARHFCVLHDTERLQYDSNEISVLIDNSFYTKCKKMVEDILYHKHKDSLFILTTRNRTDWYHSISKFHSLPKDLPDICQYEKLVRSIFRSIGKEDNLLVINIFEDPKCVKKICRFINVELQDIEFPHVKKEHEIELNDIIKRRIVLTSI